ncbi:MAG: glucose 1-dehydrogenase [Geminicoccaceae bacterium]|nr:glucose 1-dehydrogenase [Geminicoccaceae bacterium]
MADFVERFSLTGKRAFVTGASKGIGLEVCKVLADAGADIVACARNPEGLAGARAAVEAKGRECLVVEAEMADAASIRAAARTALDRFGTIDILVNNAGVALIADLLEATVEDWDATMAINLRAPFVLAQALAPAMIAQKSGKIINLSSQAGVIALPGHGAYCASKGGLNMLTKMMTCEWSPHNIQVNAVCPTVILTDMGNLVWAPEEVGGPMRARIPLGRFGQPIEVADLILFLASPASDLITGETVLIDGGYTAL